MERKLVFSKNGNIYLDSCMTQSAFSKSRLSLRLTENGYIATKNNDGWSFSNWFFTGTNLDEQDSVLFEGPGFSGLTLKDFFDTQDSSRQNFASALVCSAIESALEQNISLYAIGAGGIIISSEFERIIFLPFNLYDISSQCAGKELYASSEGIYINKLLKDKSSLRFTQAVIAYKAIAGVHPFLQQEQELREEDYKDNNYIPLEQKVYSLDSSLSNSIDAALTAKTDDNSTFPIEVLYKELGVTKDGNTTEIIRKTNISKEKFEELVKGKQKAFQKKLAVKRWIRHNRTGITISIIALAIVLCIAGCLLQGNLQLPTTKGLTAFETTEMFYSALNNIDATGIKESARCKAASNITNMVSNIYVASRTRNAYNFKDKTVSPAEWFNFNYDGSYTIYGLSQFSIESEKGSLFFEGPIKKTFPKSISTQEEVKDKDTKSFAICYKLIYNEGYDILFVEDKVDTATLTFAGNRWIITDIQQETISEQKIQYKEFVEEYNTVLEQEEKNILRTAKVLRERYDWIPSNSELLEAENKQKAQSTSIN